VDYSLQQMYNMGFVMGDTAPANNRQLEYFRKSNVNKKILRI
jgi:hypothetical protein